MTFLKRTAVAGLMLTLFTGVGYGMDSFVERLTDGVEKTINGTASLLVRTLEPGAETSPQTDRRHKETDPTSFIGAIEDVFKGLAREVAGPVGLWAYDGMPVMSAAIRVAGVVAPMEERLIEERKQKAREEREHREREEKLREERIREEREHREREEKITREHREREERAREERARTLHDARQKNIVKSPLFYGAFRLAYDAGSMAYTVARVGVGITTSCVYGILYLLWGDRSKGD